MERNYEAIAYIGLYYLIINFLLFLFIFVDKRKAIKNKWRIKESTLFKLFLLGGFLGGFLSMKIFNHKTKKKKFYFIGIASLLLHLSIIFLLIKFI